MKKINLIFSTGTAAILFLSTTGLFAQQKVDLTMSAIPNKLFWENRPLKYSFKNGVLSITAGAKTDMFRDPNVTYNTDNAPKLLFETKGDFVFTAAVSHAFVHKWDGGALVIKQDSLHWIKFCFEKDYTGAHRVVSVVTREVSDDCNSVEIPANKVFYKIAKAGNVITLYYSVNGNKWFLIRHLQFDLGGKPFYLGFLAQSPTGGECEVKFSNITYQARKISDPYLGE